MYITSLAHIQLCANLTSKDCDKLPADKRVEINMVISKSNKEELYKFFVNEMVAKKEDFKSAILKEGTTYSQFEVNRFYGDPEGLLYYIADLAPYSIVRICNGFYIMHYNVENQKEEQTSYIIIGEKASSF